MFLKSPQLKQIIDLKQNNLLIYQFTCVFFKQIFLHYPCLSYFRLNVTVHFRLNFLRFLKGRSTQKVTESEKKFHSFFSEITEIIFATNSIVKLVLVNNFIVGLRKILKINTFCFTDGIRIYSKLYVSNIWMSCIFMRCFCVSTEDANGSSRRFLSIRRKVSGYCYSDFDLSLPPKIQTDVCNSLASKSSLLFTFLPPETNFVPDTQPRAACNT